MSSKKRFNRKKAVENLARIFADPIVADTTATLDEIPKTLRERIITARVSALVEAYTNKKESYDLATDEEALAYLITASLRTPFNDDWADIFMWLGRQYFSMIGIDTPDFFDVELNDYQKDLLIKLRRWIKERQNRNWKKMKRDEKDARIDELSEGQKEFVEETVKILEAIWLKKAD